MRSLVAAGALARQHRILLQRYGFNTLASMLSVYVIFLVIFLGANAFIATGPAKGNTLREIIVGYFVWVVGIAAFGDSAEDISREASEGTLEQLAMTPLGLNAVMLIRFVTGLAFTLLVLLAFLFAMMATTGHWLHLDLASLIPLVILTTIGAQGIGLMVAGLALVFKRVQALQQLVQFAFVALVAVPVDRAPFLKLLPLSWGNELISRVGVEGTPLWRMPLGDVVFLVAHAFVWLGAGLLVFRALTERARDRALLGQY